MSSGQYTYDTTGQSYFFALALLLLVLLPYTYFTLKSSSQTSAPYPCKGWNEKSPAVKRAAALKSPISTRYLLLTIGWMACAVIVQRASLIQAESALYNPFDILKISTSSTEKEIRKHFKTLSKKFHPDKIVLEGNQTKEEVDSHFVELTKAYKSLTDEDIRRNFELFGHPDGKQEFSMGIALPSWVVESRNIGWVMGAYAIILGIMLPYYVSRWWHGSRKLTKDGVLNTSVAIFFQALEEETTFSSLLDILASADEYKDDERLIKLRKAMSKAGIDEYARLASTIREGVDGRAGWVGYAGWAPSKKRARVLIAAHLLRIPITDSNLLREKQATVTIALPLTTSLSSITLARSWLSPTITIIHLQQCLIQAVHPSSSPLLQLPYFNQELVARAAAANVSTVAEFGHLGTAQVESILSGLKDREKRSIYEVAKNWPVLDYISGAITVVGEKTVAPGSIVTFTVQLKLSPPGRALATSPMSGIDSSKDNLAGEESTVEELIGRRAKGADGEDPSPFVHAPEFPRNRKPTWYIFVGDHKLDRIFVPPQKFTDMGSKLTRTIRITFQAPPGPGLYTFQAHVMNDSFVGTDHQQDIRMTVNPPTTELVGDEDEISEPDEDTIAGQMAMMRGQPAKARAGDDDDDTSGTEESENDSDSDSDSD